MARRIVKAFATTTFDGVALRDVLAKGGVALGEELEVRDVK